MGFFMKKAIVSIFSLAVIGGALFPPSVSNATPAKSCVTLYEDIKYKGKSKKFCGTYKYVGKEWNNKASSAKFTLKKGKEIILHDKKGTTGLGIFLSESGSIPDFRNTHGTNFNDKTSSILEQDK